MDDDAAGHYREALMRVIQLCEDRAAFAESQQPVARQMGLDLAFAAWSGASAAALGIAKEVRGMLDEVGGA